MSDNRSAFPVNAANLGGPGSYEADPGMSLRDYFAVHADQPGVSEIVTMAGGETDGFMVKFSRDSEGQKFNDWWNDLPLADRLDLSARVRYAMADAMMVARDSRSKPEG